MSIITFVNILGICNTEGSFIIISIIIITRQYHSSELGRVVAVVKVILQVNGIISIRWLYRIANKELRR